MAIKFRYIILIIFLIAPQYLFCDEFNLLSDLKKQTENYRAEANILEKLINDNSIRLDSLARELKSLDEEIQKLSELLSEIDLKNLSDKDKLILEETEVSAYNAKIQGMKESFRNKIIWLYKNGADYPMQVIFSSASLNQMYVRLQYLTQISRMRAKDFEKIKIDTYILDEKKKILNLNAKEKLKYLSDKKESQREVLLEKRIKENTFDSLKSVNDMLNREKDRYYKFISTDDSLTKISDLNISYNIFFSPDYKDIPFKNLKGRLIYPVKSVVVINDFGKNIHPTYKTLSYNNGIDFSVARGSDVKAVASGIVEYILDMPLYGKVIVINHGDYYTSLYGLVEKINVSQGQTVSAGQIIALSSENIEGQNFHFEIRENGIPLNPNDWIKWW